MQTPSTAKAIQIGPGDDFLPGGSGESGAGWRIMWWFGIALGLAANRPGVKCNASNFRAFTALVEAANV